MSSNAKGRSNENIQVYVRCRPTNNRERNIHSHEMVRVTSEREVVVKHMMDKMTKKYAFDRAFGPESKQADVYSAVVAPLINEVLAGYNCTVFAYGQTGTGKTHTMIGDETPQMNSSYEDLSDVGIIPRALSHLFEDLRLMDVEFSMRISYLELYNEELSDLLSSNDITQIRIFEDPNKKGAIIVQGLEEIPVHSTADVYKLLAKGQEKRKMAPTLMNAQSSRSHTIFSILVHIKENGIDGEELMKIGKLNLVDLAGSENITKAGNEKGIRTRETVNINQSLLTLGRVITALVERTPHIPYRESKLTRLLQESLGGRTKTSIIATISPGHKDLEETMSTLEYAHRAKNIQNKPELNQKLTKKTVLKEYTEEIDRLKRDLMAARDKNGVYLAEETYNQMQYLIESQNKEISEQTIKLKTQKDGLTMQQDLLNEIKLDLVERKKELQEKETVLQETEQVLEKTKRGYQEKKQILMKHMHTETILTNQARQLIDVADTVSNDVNALHATISRRKDYENINREACRKLDVSMNDHLATMTDNLKTYSYGFERHANSIIDHMNLNTNQSKAMCTSSVSNLRLLIECEQQAKTEIDSCLANHKVKFTELFTKHTEDNRITLENAIDVKKEFCRQLDALQTNMNEKMKVFEMDYSSLLELITNNSSTVSNFCQSLSSTLKTNATNIAQLLQTNYKVIDETTSANEELTANMANLLDQMKKLMEQSTDNNIKIKNLSPELKAQEMKVANELTENLIAISAYNSQQNEQINDFTVTLGKCDASMKTIDSHAIELVQINKKKDDELMGTLNAINADVTKQNAEVSTKLEDMLNEIGNINELTEINVEAGLNRVINDISIDQERIESYFDQFTELHSNLEAVHNDYQHKLTNDIDVCVDRLNRFHNDEVKIYTPTGQTPSKRDYSYPRVLAATSPHSKIVNEFWTNHNGSPLNCSAIISEEPTECEPLNESGIDGNQSSSMSNASDTLANSVDISDRTLQDSRTLNAYSTPIIFNNNLRKLPNSFHNPNREVMHNEIPEENKEN